MSDPSPETIFHQNSELFALKVEEVGAKCEISARHSNSSFFFTFSPALLKQENLLSAGIATFCCKKAHTYITPKSKQQSLMSVAHEASRIEATNYSITLIACNFKGSIYQSGKATFLKNPARLSKNLSLDNCLTFFCHSLVIAEP